MAMALILMAKERKNIHFYTAYKKHILDFKR
jgi:hypothetical protein